jgi:hypothetical protein
MTLNISVPFPVSAWIGLRVPEVDTANGNSSVKTKKVILLAICKLLQRCAVDYLTVELFNSNL